MIVTATAVLACTWFAIGPPVSNSDARIAELDATLDVLGAAPTVEGTQALILAIREIESHPRQTAADSDVQARLIEARLALAWAHLTHGDDSAAAAAMDEAIRSARGRDLALEPYGPNLVGLYDDRMAVLEQTGRAAIEVDCGTPCHVIINEWSATPTATAPLLLGHYRVWIGPQDPDVGEIDWEFHDVVLSEAGETLRIAFEAGLVPVPTLDRPPADRPSAGQQAYIVALKREKARDEINRGAILAGVSVVFLVASGLSIARSTSAAAFMPDSFWIGSAIAHGVLGGGLLIGGVSVLGMGVAQRKRLRVAAMPTGALTPMMLPRGAGLGFTLRM